MATILPSNLEPSNLETRLPTMGGRPQVPAPTEIALSEFAGLLWRQRWVMLACLAVSLTLMTAYTWRARPLYESASMIRFEHEQVNLPQLVEQLTTENRISTEIEVLQGRSAAEAVVDSLGLRATLVAPRKGAITRIFPVMQVAAAADTATFRFRVDGDSGFAVWRDGHAGAAVYGTLGERMSLDGVTFALAKSAAGERDIRLRISSREGALATFQNSLKITRPARDADLIRVSFRARDPELAARSANLLAEYLIASRQSELERRTGLAVNFLRSQVDSVRQELRAAEDKLQAYRQSVGAVNPPEQARAQVGRLTQLQADQVGLRSERDALATTLRQIALDSVTSPDRPSPYRRLLGFPSILRNNMVGGVLNDLVVLENERAALLRRRTWQDPDVRALSTRIQELDSQLRSIATTYLEGLTNQVAELERANRQFGRSLDSLPRMETQTGRLQRETSLLEGLYATMQTRLKDAEMTQAVQDPAVSLVDRAYAAGVPIRPRPMLNLSLSLVLGSLLGLSLSLGREMSDRSVRSRADALQTSGLPVLGAIPRVQGRFPQVLKGITGRAKLKTIGDVLRGAAVDPVGSSMTTPSSAAAAEIHDRLVLHPDTAGAYSEAFNQLQANLALAYEEKPIGVLVFTSPLPGEGKTLSAINYAVTAAAAGKKVLLLDADTRCGLVNQVFGYARQPGFTELLSGKARVEQVVRGLTVNRNTRLAILPTGTLLTGPSRALSVERLRVVLGAMRGRFDLIVIDSPPVNVLADAALLGAAADAVILVVRSGRTQRDALSFAMDQLQAAKAPVIGTILNDIELDRRQYEEGGYRYLAEVEKYHAAVP
jgi:capsular exopolysaccharide synthesis family protein